MKKPSLLILCLLSVNACCNEDFIIPEKDFRETAIDVTSLINSCSANGAYTTMGATPAGNAGSCWNNSGPLFTRWFKFKGPATTDATIILQVGPEYGTQRKSLLALWDEDGTTELGCETYSIFNDDAASLYLYDGNLTPDAWYYFSVDVMDAQSRGTFTLCLTDSD